MGSPVDFDTIRLLVFHGGPAGPAASPALDVPYPGRYTILQSPDAAGDVNGDGYDDMVVVGGTYNAKTGWLLLGSATGLQPTPWWTLPGAQAATGLGDVNGDGLDDVALIRRYGFDWRRDEGVLDVVQGMTDPAADDDGDGATNLDDCADHDPARHPGVAEIWSDDLDQNCDGYDRTFALRAPLDGSPGDRQTAYVTPAQPGDVVRLFVSTTGPGAGRCAPGRPDVCLGLASPLQIATATATATGPIRVTYRRPAGTHIWLQAALQATNGSVAVSDVNQAWAPTP